MKPFILQLDTIDRRDRSQAGGKAAHLGAMIQNGFPVPPGFVVTVAAYQAFVNGAQLFQEAEGLAFLSPEKRGAVGDDDPIRQKMIHSPLPSDLADAIHLSCKRFSTTGNGAPLFAVRSSAPHEDSSEASFAGQYDTFYHVHSEDLIPMITRCFASLWRKEAIYYRHMCGADHTDAAMAVIVQEMIQADISGIAFTSNPVTGNRDEILIDASWGLGAAIADGKVTPDHYVLDRNSQSIRQKRIGRKRFMVHTNGGDADKLSFKEVPSALQTQETLSHDHIMEIATWALKAERLFNSPQDIEFAICDNRLYILQSRPMTANGAADRIGSDVKGKFVIFKPVLENFTAPISPLSVDLFETETPRWVRFIDGWCYINLKYLRPFVPFKLSDRELAKFFSGGHSVLPKMPISFIRLCLLGGLGCIGYLMLGVFFARTRNLPDDAISPFQKLCHAIENDPAYGIAETFSRLWALTRKRFFDPVWLAPGLVNLSSTRYFFLTEALRILMGKWLPRLRPDAVDFLCSGGEGILTAQMGREIYDLASVVKGNATLFRVVKEHSPEHMCHALEQVPEADDFLNHLKRFLSRYGHRGFKEFELSSPRWAEDPSPVLGMIKTHLDRDLDPEIQDRKTRHRRLSIETEIREGLASNPIDKRFQIRWRLLKWIANRSKHFMKLRENSRHYHIMGLSVTRKKILSVETRLLSKGKLKCKDDIFFLKLSEISQLMDSQITSAEADSLVRKRRRKYSRLSKMVPPKAIGLDQTLDDPTGHTVKQDGSIELSGLPSSPGVYEGTARVIIDPADGIELKAGEIIVAPYTDHAWTPLFLSAGALVVEVGSYLSHASTIAREFGLPCVVDVSSCTDLIKTGDVLKVNGDLGRITLIRNNGS